METLGNALFTPLVLEFAPLPDRIQHIIARLGQVPLFLDQASTNLVSSPEVWTKVAIEENAGNIDLVDKSIREKVPPELQDAYQRAAGPALAAMRKFQDYLENSLMARQADWRLGQDLYTRKFRYTMRNRDVTRIRCCFRRRATWTRCARTCWSWPCRSIGKWSRDTRTTRSWPATSASTK